MTAQQPPVPASSPPAIKILSTTTPTTAYSRAYLEWAWQNRKGLLEYQRYGFGVFFYVTVCGHLEACMAHLIDRRLMYARSVVQRRLQQDFSWDPTLPSHSLAPLREMEDMLLAKVRKAIDSAALLQLVEQFETIFNVKVKDVLGLDLKADLDAIGKLRNVFAHGRDFSMKFSQDDENTLDLSGSAFEEAGKRLVSAGVIASLKFTGQNHQEFTSTLFQDKALLYFLGKAREIEAKLKDVPAFQPELEMPILIALPDLKLES